MLFWVKFICPAGDSSSRALVVMLIGAFIVFCSPGASAADIYPLFHEHFFKASLVGIQFTNNRPSVSLFLFPGALKFWCGTIATMFLASSWTRQSRPLLFFPSWLYILDGEDNCMLSVPLSTSDLHFSCWQRGENCQAVAAGAFMLLGYALWFSSKGGCSPFLSSCPRVVCSMFPVFQA